MQAYPPKSPAAPVTHTLFQVSTSGALVAGLFSGVVSCKTLLQHGDFGLGTFADLDGVQEEAQYGRKSGVELGPYDTVKYAEAFGAIGLMIRTADEIAPMLKKAFDTPGPVIVGIQVDYSDNHKLFEMVDENSIHCRHSFCS